MDNLKEMIAGGKISHRFILAILATILTYSVVFILLCYTVPAGNNDIVFTAIGYMFAKMGDAFGYFFGGSKDKSDDDKAFNVQEIIKTSKENPILENSEPLKVEITEPIPKT